MKSGLRLLIKALLTMRGLIARGMRRPGADAGTPFLAYHSVGGGFGFELDLELPMFRHQLHHIAKNRRVVRYEDAVASLCRGAPLSPSSLVLTFDDGYEDFFTHVYPLLKELEVPATLFVTTGFVEDRKPYPMLSNPRTAATPVTWEMLGEMQASGLVTIGAHTHTHPVLEGAPESVIEEEMARPIEIFRSRLGIVPHHMAYPRSEFDAVAMKIARRHYDSAAGGGGKAALASGFDPFGVPRVPIRRSDGWWYFRAKLDGVLDSEEAFYARLRRARGLRGRGPSSSPM